MVRYWLGRRPRAILTAGLAASTLRLYNRAVARFLTWAGVGHLGIAGLPPTAELLDEALIDYVEYLWNTGGRTTANRATAQQAVSGLQAYYPRLRRYLPLATRALSAWTASVDSVGQAPATWHTACLVAARLASDGHWELGIATLLAFDAFLRPAMTLHFDIDYISFPNDGRLGRVNQQTVLTVSGKNVTDLDVAVRKPVVSRLLAMAVSRARTRGRTKLFEFSYAQWNAAFKAAGAGVGLPELRLYSLRRGGATEAYMQGWPLADVKRHGGWRSTTSCLKYLRQGRAMALARGLPQTVQGLAADSARDIEDIFRMTR